MDKNMEWYLMQLRQSAMQAPLFGYPLVNYASPSPVPQAQAGQKEITFAALWANAMASRKV